jgi:hypothetical protein
MIAAATNGTSNYAAEAKAVAAQYGYVDGTNNATVTASGVSGVTWFLKATVSAVINVRLLDSDR